MKYSKPISTFRRLTPKLSLAGSQIALPESAPNTISESICTVANFHRTNELKHA